MSGAEDFHLRRWPKGANNIASLERLPDGHIREGVNVDCLPDGNVRVRAGRQLRAALSNATGAIEYGNNAVIADNGVLRLFNASTNSLAELGLVPQSGAFAGAELNGELFVCTQVDRLRIKHDRVLPWGTDDVQAAITVIAGTLPEGIYRVAVVGLTADGIESGSTPLIVSLGDLQALRIDFTLPEGAAKARLYATAPNGDTLYLQQERDGAPFLLQNIRSDTARLMTENLTAPPVGDQVVAHGSRLLIVSGHVLHFTEPFMPHHYNRLKGFIAFGGAISVVVSLDDVIYVCADKTWAIQGLGTESQSVRVVLDVGAVKGTGVRINEVRAAWLTKYGQAFGDAAGNVTLPTKLSYAPPLSTHGSSDVLESSGASIIVTALRGQVQANGLGLKDQYDLEII